MSNRDVFCKIIIITFRCLVVLSLRDFIAPFQVSKLLNSGVYLIHKELITLLQDESLEVISSYSLVFISFLLSLNIIIALFHPTS